MAQGLLYSARSTFRREHATGPCFRTVDHHPGGLALEVLRRAPGGTLRFEDYARRLFEPDAEIRALARTIRRQADAYQDLKHIRCDVYRGVVRVNPPLPDEWYLVSRCSPGTRPYQERAPFRRA